MRPQDTKIILHTLVKEAFLLLLIAVFGFLLAEAILPGIFSQRVSFFWVLVGCMVGVGVVVLASRGLNEGASPPKEESESMLLEGILWGSVIIFFGIMFITLLSMGVAQAVMLSLASTITFFVLAKKILHL